MSDSHIGYENRTETGRGGTVSWVEDISTTDAFNTAAAIAMVSEAQAIVHTGDILDHEVDEPRLATVETTLSTLDAKGVLVYCILGSHDRDSRHAIGRRSVDGVEILREWVDNIYLIELNTSPTQVGTSGISLYGISAGNIGLADIGTADSLEWAPDDVEFAPAPPGPNILCLHNRVKTYKNGARTEAINLDRLLSMAAVSFDCVLIGDEHRPLNQDFEAGYEFHAQDGTPILYTGPTERIGAAYADHDLIVTELTVQDGGVDIM